MLIYSLMIIITVCFSAIAFYCPRENIYNLTSTGTKITIKSRNFIIALSFLPMFLVSAFRYDVGVDYMSYTFIFEAANQGKAVHTENGYKLLNQIIGAYTNNPQILYIVTSAITLLLIVYGIYKYSNNPAMSLYLFMTMGYIFSSFNILRQYIAIGLIFVGLKFIKENKFAPFLMLVLVAMTFHKTAIIMIPMFFILRLRIKQSYFFMITMACIALVPLRGVLRDILVNIFYPQYAGTDLIQPLSLFEFIYYAVIFFLLIIMCYAYKEKFFKDDYNLILFNAVFFSFVIYLGLSFIPEINRIAIYLEFFVILLIPRLLSCESNKKVRIFYYIFIVIFFMIFFIVSIGIIGRYDVLPYQVNY